MHVEATVALREAQDRKRRLTWELTFLAIEHRREDCLQVNVNRLARAILNGELD